MIKAFHCLKFWFLALVTLMYTNRSSNDGDKLKLQPGMAGAPPGEGGGGHLLTYRQRIFSAPQLSAPQLLAVHGYATTTMMYMVVVSSILGCFRRIHRRCELQQWLRVMSAVSSAYRWCMPWNTMLHVVEGDV